MDWANQPPPHKHYPEVPRIELPSPGTLPAGPSDLWQALHGRRSRRDFSANPLRLEDLALLIWACQGITARQGPHLLRTAPSAGALYPFETYVSVQAVEGLHPCLAHLHVPSFTLEVLGNENPGPGLAAAALGQGFVRRAATVFVWTVVLPRSAWKYGDRSLRYIGLDLGHVCQNLCLAAEALGFGCCPVAAFFDREVDGLLGVDGQDEFSYYMAAVGSLD